MDLWRQRTLRATIVLLVTSFLLIGPTLAGIGSSWLFIGVLVGLAVVLAAIQPAIPDFPELLGHNTNTYAQDLWLSPALGAIFLVLIAPSASPGELQAVGGIAGLLGMLNYFLRPVYFFVYDLFANLLGNSPSTREQTTNREMGANGRGPSTPDTSPESRETQGSLDQTASAGSAAETPQDPPGSATVADPQSSGGETPATSPGNTGDSRVDESEES